MTRPLDQLVPCETWDLALPAHPLHSRLYALEPLGLGTPHVESLTSYVTRLAEAHSVSLRTLTLQELLPLLRRPYLSRSFGNGLCSFWKEAARALNGTGALARDWVQVLERLTLRTDLRFLTLLPWATVLTQQRLLRSTRAWCPECFMEWQTAELPIYEPLLWNLSAVSLCLRHQRALLRQCPYPDCHAVLPLLASHIHPGYCSKCSRWLGVINKMNNEPFNISWTTEEWHRQIWVAETVGKLVAHNTNLTVTPQRVNIPDLITAYREQVAGSMQDLAENLQLARRTLHAWQIGEQVPQMGSLMRLCYCCGASLYDLFTLQTGTPKFGDLKIRSLPDIPNSSRKRRHPFDAIRIRQILETTLASEEQPPPAMRTVAKHLSYSPKELREHFPELCRAISMRYENYCKVRGEQKVERLKEDVRQAMLNIHSQGLYPSSHKVGSFLDEPAVMRTPVISSFWHEMLQELGQAD